MSDSKRNTMLYTLVGRNAEFWVYLPS